jgi:hypothetical protein
MPVLFLKKIRNRKQIKKYQHVAGVSFRPLSAVFGRGKSEEKGETDITA